jgi:hypothetical protein
MSIQEIIAILVSIAAIFGFLFGVFQYWQAQKWKRLEFAANQIQRLTTEPDLALAVSFLEYSKMKIPLPEKYQVFAADDDKVKIFDHDSKDYSKVMELDYFKVDANYFIYRQSTMRLFEYLQQIHQFIAMGLIKTNDVAGLKWVLDMIFYPRYIDQSILLKHLEKDFEEIIALKNELA